MRPYRPAGAARTLCATLLLAAPFCRRAADLDPSLYGYPPGYFDFKGPTPSRARNEAPVTIPPYPGRADLMAVPMPDGTAMRVFLDRRSLSRGADGVVRYTLVLQSRSGVWNVFYEGMRCETGRYKTYALGSGHDTFDAVAGARWQRIPYHERNAYRYMLYRHYLCDSTFTGRQPAAILRGLARAYDP